MIGGGQWLPELSQLHREAIAAAKLPFELHEPNVPPAGLHDLLASFRTDEQFLGAALTAPYARPALAYCQYASASAASTGIVDTIIRGRDGSLYADTTAVHALIDSLAGRGVHTVRTALILGGGNLARVALAALREMGCQRYLVGYRHPRRPLELSSLYKGLRRNLGFFPLAEMRDFFDWAEGRGLLGHRSNVPPPEDLPGKKKNSDQSFKRWDILVQATPVGLRLDEEPLVNNDSFLRCFNYVMDLVPAEETTLSSLARQAGVPSLSGLDMLRRQAEMARSLWTAQLRRIERGEPDAPLDFEGHIAVEARRVRRSRRPGEGQGRDQRGRGDGRGNGQPSQPSKSFVVKRRG
jgi:shikimate 5-dehydrogenase